MAALMRVIAANVYDVLKDVEDNIDLYSVLIDNDGNCIHVELIVEDSIDTSLINRIGSIFGDDSPMLCFERDVIKLVMINRKLKV